MVNYFFLLKQNVIKVIGSLMFPHDCKASLLVLIAVGNMPASAAPGLGNTVKQSYCFFGEIQISFWTCSNSFWTKSWGVTQVWAGFLEEHVHSCSLEFCWIKNKAECTGCVQCLIIQLFLTLCNPMDYVDPQAPLFMKFSRQEYWSGLPFPPPEDLPDPGIELTSPALQADSLPSVSPGSFLITLHILSLIHYKPSNSSNGNSWRLKLFRIFVKVTRLARRM